jgi:enoyl-CoA hydratase/3-hydroxyacyl-CoA dehydrogenase
VLSGAGKAFVAGADLKFFVDKQAAGDIAGIVGFAKEGQALYRRIERCPKRVIAVLDGLTLGGGAELALACHVIVATPRARLGFPETGLGIYPGLGGTQRLVRRVGKGVARQLLYSGQMLSGEELFALKLAWKVVAPSEIANTVKEAIESAPVQEKAGELPKPLAAVARFLEVDNAAGLADGSLTLPGGPEVAELAKKVRRKAPLAILAVEKLTALAATVELDRGLDAEIEAMAPIFASADAREGIRAMVEKRFPKFVGA